MSEDPRRSRSPGPPAGELDPAASPGRWERSVTSILRAAGPELRRRAAAPGVAGLIGRWARPLVAAAAAVIVAASAAILQSAGDGSGADDRVAATAAGPRQTETTAGLETALYPAPVGSWMEGNERPTVEEIVFSASVGQ